MANGYYRNRCGHSESTHDGAGGHQYDWNKMEKENNFSDFDKDYPGLRECEAKGGYKESKKEKDANNRS